MYIYLPITIASNFKSELYKELNLALYDRIELIFSEFDDVEFEECRVYKVLLNNIKKIEFIKFQNITSIEVVDYEKFVDYIHNSKMLNWNAMTSFIVNEGKYLFSKEMFDDFINYLNIDSIFENYDDIDYLLKKFLNNAHIHRISINANFKEEHFIKYFNVENEINWELISYNENFQSEFFEKNFETLKYLINWTYLSVENKLSNTLKNKIKKYLFK